MPIVKGKSPWNKGKRRPLMDRFLDYIEVNLDTGCWLWIGSKNKQGYGRFVIEWNKANNRPDWRRAHHWAYEQFVGPIPDELHLLHKCPGGGNASCVNPAHLKPGDQLENMDDRRKAGRDLCGERNPKAVKLTIDDANYIRSYYKIMKTGVNGSNSIKAAAEKYGVDRSTIRSILDGSHWLVRA